MTAKQKKLLIIGLVVCVLLVALFFAWRAWGPQSLRHPAKDEDDLANKIQQARDKFGPYIEPTSDQSWADIASASHAAGYDYQEHSPYILAFFKGYDIGLQDGRAIATLQALIDQYISGQPVNHNQVAVGQFKLHAA